jgi:hypothetical protein
MRIKATLAAMAGFVLLNSVGCGGDSKSTTQQMCEKLDSCNELPAGVDLKSCVESFDQALKAGTTSQRSDWESGTQQCLKLQDCVNFSACEAPLLQ